MYIPKMMINKIANTFYDKEFTILKEESGFDEEGGIINGSTKNVGDYKGNVSFSQCKVIQEEYGLDYNIDISISTFIGTPIELNDIIEYQDKKYKVTDILKSDSHITIVGVLCK